VDEFPGFARSISSLQHAITGDVIYACKPRATSLGVALLTRLRKQAQVVVDIDDRDIYQCYPYSHHVVKNLALSVREWTHPNAYPLTLAMDRLVTSADHVTSVSSYFRHLYGGTIIPQAVDTDLFNPARYDRAALRRQWGLDGYRVVLFLGRPLPHKGLDEILAAVEQSQQPDVRLVVVGGWTPYMEELRQRERVIFLGQQPFEAGPSFLAMADVVMVPQRAGPLSQGQMPTKITEAMAMGVPVIATAVSDIADQIGEGGLVVPVGDLAALTRALDRVLDDDEWARALGQKARERAIAQFSMTAVRPLLEEVFARYKPS